MGLISCQELRTEVDIATNPHINMEEDIIIIINISMEVAIILININMEHGIIILSTGIRRTAVNIGVATKSKF
jgi:hypothetical protein